MQLFNASKAGLQWTPYAQAIAAHYPTIIPLYTTVPTGLTGAGQERYISTEPLQHDALLFGAQLLIEDSAAASDNGQQTFLSVGERRSGLFWVSTGFPDAIPATAFGGVAGQPMPVLALPEAYFLPAGSELQHIWKSLVNATSGGVITWIGVQLINKTGVPAPACVDLDGCLIKVGGRLPWFDVLGLGLQAASAGIPTFSLVNQIQFTGYTAPADCDVEIHGIEANFFLENGVSTTPDNIRITISDEGDRRMWGFNFTPAPAIAGSYTQGYPSLPFTRPYLLKRGRRLQFDIFNLSGADLNEGYLTVRGVKRCSY